ncbi:MAG: TolB family protein [Bacillota bacterium]
MQTRALAETAIAVRRHLYGILLILGVAGLFQLLFSDMRMTLSAGAIPTTGGTAARISPLTQGASMDGFGAWSPDGKQIVFMRDGQILLTDPSGRKERVMTTEPEHWDAAPAWRPDGRAIAFARLSMQGGPARVMLMTPGKGQPEEVAREDGSIGYVAWSPDGRSLYFSTKDRLMRVDLRGPKIERVFAAPRGWELLSGGLAVARDGKSLIYGAGPRLEEGVQYDLWRLPLGGGQPQRLTTRGGIMPALDPGGHLLVYRNPRQETGIYLMNLATRATERVVPDEPKAMYFHPSFSPDGRNLVLSRLLLAAPPSRGRGGFTSNLYLHSLEGSGGDR